MLSLENGPASLPELYLQPKKADLPFTLPAHLKTHAAARGDRGARLAVHGATPSTRLLLGIGAAKEYTPQEAAEWGEAIGYYLNTEQISEVRVVFPHAVRDRDVLLNFAKGISMANFRVDELKAKSPNKRSELKKVYLAGSARDALDKKALAEVAAIAQGIAFARTVAELPPSHGGPEALVERFKKTVDSQPDLKRSLQIEVWDEKRIVKEGMGLLHAVGKGSDQPPRFLITRFGKDLPGKRPTLYLVGKGVCFDTGGINIKAVPYKDLLAMKKDMSGAAAVLGAMIAIARVKPGIRVVGLTPLCINAVGSRAVLPGDVITSYSGKTVEIQNTDAEGRLILADALHYAYQSEADWIVDVATLTGACVVALGSHHSGLFSNHSELQDTLMKVTESSGEPAWPLPMSPRYGEELKSDVADLSNMGSGRNGGAITAAKFLENFVGQVPWCHLDIAGTDELGKPAAGSAAVKASGRMVHSFVTLAQSLK